MGAANLGQLGILTAVAIWAGTYVVTDAALERSGPFTILALRFVLALVVLVPLAVRRGWRPRQALEPRFIAFGLTGIVLHLGLETFGLMFTTPAQASLVIAAIPAVTVAMAVVFLGERPTRPNLVGIALSVIGVMVISYTPAPGGGSLALLGNTLVFGGVVAWGFFTVQGRRLSGLSPIVSTTAAAAASLLFLVPLALGETFLTGAPRVDAGGIGAILYLGILASGAAFALWNASLRYVTASSASGYVNLVPVLGVLIAIVAGDTVGPAQISGGAIVAAGIWLISRKAPAPVTA